MSRFNTEEEQQNHESIVQENMKNGLKLLYAFGAVYFVGFGLSFVNNVYNLINLAGYRLILKEWFSNEKFCEFFLFFDEVCNLLMNLLNSMIIVQSSQVKGSLKSMYTVATTRRMKRSNATQPNTDEVQRQLLNEQLLIGSSQSDEIDII